MGEFLAGPYGSWLRVLAATVLSMLYADLQAGANIDWKAYGAAALLALLPIVIAWVNPKDPRFGTNAT